MAALAAHAGTFSPAGDRSWRSSRWRSSSPSMRWLPRVPGYDRRARAPAPPRRTLLGLRVETIGSRFGGIPAGLPHFAMPAFRAVADPDAADRRRSPSHARRDRVADVGGGRRPDERRPAQLEHGAGRAGHRQHRVAALRRPARHRRDRPHGHQHPLGRANAGRRHRARADAARDPARRARRSRARFRWRCSRPS